VLVVVVMDSIGAKKGGGSEQKKNNLSSGEEEMDKDMQEILGERIEGLPTEFDGDARGICLVLAHIDNNDGALTH
jgi:hypothetical protein